MSYASVFWDWNGTLLDDAAESVSAVNLSLKKRSLPFLTPEKYGELFKFPVYDYYVDLGFDFTKEDYSDLVPEYVENYFRCAGNAKLRRNAEKVLKKLASNSVRQYVLSASNEEILTAALKKYGIDFYFDGVIAPHNSDAVGKLEVARNFFSDNSPGEKVLIVGDTEHDCEIAESLGCDCCLIYSGHNSAERIKKTGKRILSDLYEVVPLVLDPRIEEFGYPYAQFS